MTRLTLAVAIVTGVIVAAALGYVGFLSVDAGSPSVFRNVTGAMEPTLLIGDRITTRSLRTDKGELLPVRRGDLVIHEWPLDRSKLFVKRLVGLPGDTLAMHDGVLQVNARAMSEPYAWRAEPSVDPKLTDFDWAPYRITRNALPSSPPSRSSWGPILVPPDAFFVLGDNRDNSLDSRYWGFLETQHIIGIAHRVYFSRDPATGDIRWSRFGRRLR